MKERDTVVCMHCDRIYSMELWSNCSTDCDFCYHKQTDPIYPDFHVDSIEDQVHVLEDLKNFFLKHKDGLRLEVLLYGGELFENDVFSQCNMGEFFRDQIGRCIGKLTLTSGLITVRMDVIDKFLSSLKPEQLKTISLFTSWDPAGRFKTKKLEELFFSRIDYLREKYPDINVQINIAISGEFCRRVIKNEIPFDYLREKTTTELSLTLYQLAPLEYAPDIDELTQAMMIIFRDHPIVASRFINNFCDRTDGYCLWIYDKEEKRIRKAKHLPRFECDHLDFNKWTKGFVGKCIYCYLQELYNLYKNGI